MTESSISSGNNAKVITTIAIVLATFAIVLGIIASGDNVLEADIRFAKWIQHWEGNFGEFLYRIGDMLGTTSLAATVTVIGLMLALMFRRTQIAIFLVLILLLRLAGTQLKTLFDSPRPTTDHLRLLETFDGTGYPSGHSTTVAMVSTMIVLLTWRYVADSRIRWFATIIAVIALILVGWSRIWAGAHWPSDVLGGWSFGIAMGTIAWVLSDFLVTLPIFSRGEAITHTTRLR